MSLLDLMSKFKKPAMDKLAFLSASSTSAFQQIDEMIKKEWTSKAFKDPPNLLMSLKDGI